jgi:hypothetical protein
MHQAGGAILLFNLGAQQSKPVSQQHGTPALLANPA